MAEALARGRSTASENVVPRRAIRQKHRQAGGGLSGRLGAEGDKEEGCRAKDDSHALGRRFGGSCQRGPVAVFLRPAAPPPAPAVEKADPRQNHSAAGRCPHRASPLNGALRW